MKKTIGGLVASLVMAATAHANIISAEVNILAIANSPVRYVDFTVSTAGTFTIDALGFSSLGTGYNSDTMMQLFGSTLSLASHISGDDDSGIGSDAQLTLNLGLGSYILAVTDFLLTPQLAIDGFTNDVEAPGGLIRVVIGSTDGVAQLGNAVPEPASLGLLGLGLLGVATSRRRKLG